MHLRTRRIGGVANIGASLTGCPARERQTRDNGPTRCSPKRTYCGAMSLKERVPFLRWSFWRMAIGARNITRTGQVGVGREVSAV